MGWYGSFGPASPGEVTRQFTDKDAYGKLYVKEHAWYGRSQLWGILREKDTDKPVCIIEWMVKFRRDEWLYKSVEESMGPVDVGCPLKFLDLVPIGDDPHSWIADWRARVRAERAKVRRWKVGDVLQLRHCSFQGTQNPVMTLTSLKPLRATHFGYPVRLTQRNLRDAESAPQEVV